MTKLLEQAIELASALPSDSQDEIARAILHLVAGEADAEPVDGSHLPAQPILHLRSIRSLLFLDTVQDWQ